MYFSIQLPFCCLVHFSRTQFNSETFPDPRFDPLRCQILTVGVICGPNDCIHRQESTCQLLAYGICRNSSKFIPECQIFPEKSLDIIIGVIDKIEML